MTENLKRKILQDKWYMMTFRLGVLAYGYARGTIWCDCVPLMVTNVDTKQIFDLVGQAEKLLSLDILNEFLDLGRQLVSQVDLDNQTLDSIADKLAIINTKMDESDKLIAQVQKLVYELKAKPADDSK